MTRSADVVVVGSGVAGSLVAARLAKAGLRVLILEAGPRVRRATAMAQYDKALIKIPEAPYPDTPYAPRPKSDDPDHYFLQNGPDNFGGTYLRQVGGSTWHWLGTTFRFVPDDFRLSTRFGQGVDWPLTYDELEPWYCEAEAELGVAGDDGADLGAPRSKPYPLPMIPLSYSDQVIKNALAGTPYTVQPTPQARNSKAYDGRPICCGSSSCIPICPIQAKYDATVHVSQAEKAGAELVAEAVVTTLDVGPDGRIASATIKRPDGSQDTAVGKLFVIAAHGIETPKLLLQSRTERLANGVANSSDLVGRYLMDHPTQLSWARTKEPLWPFRGPLSTGGIESTRAASWRNEHAAFRLQLANRGWEWAQGTPSSTVSTLAKQGLRGKALDQRLAELTSREIGFAAMAEQLPSRDNRIVPDFDQRDAIGVPRPRITFRIDDYTLRTFARSRALTEEVCAKLGVTELHHGDELMSAGHVMGTYRMGSDPKQSVVNTDQRAHDHSNLFLLGSGVFPTGTASNPTLTIAALALKAVEAILTAAKT